jgi:hypothetical protein
MGCAWSGGGGRSTDSTDVRWRAMTEPPRHHRTCVGARWPGHVAMGRHEPLASGPCHSNSSSIVAATVTLGVSRPSPLTETRPEIWKK